MIAPDLDYEFSKDYAHVVISGQSSNPEKVMEKLKKEVEKIKQNGLEEKTFNRIKKKIYGDYVTYNNRGAVKYDLANTKEKNSEEYNKLIKEAIEDYNEAIRLNSNYSTAFYNRGLAKLQLGKIEEAIKDFIKAYESNNNNEAKENSKNQLINLAKQGYEEAIKFCEEHNIDYKK